MSSAADDHERLEEVLGYRFRERGLLATALRHASWANEHPDDPAGDNERLEFLGDAVLDLVVGHQLMVRFPQLREGQLSVTRAQVVSESGLAAIAGTLGLGEWIKLGKGEDRSGGRHKASILADAFEAVVAAVYLDGGFPAVWELVSRLLEERLDKVEFKGFHDHKTRLQEAAQAKLKTTPDYVVVAELGPDHDKRFIVEVVMVDKVWSRAIGRSKKEAEQLAAAEAAFRLAAVDGDELESLRAELAAKPPA
ncbi:MAG: ribonuclease III [Kofleriaceae bacterium]|nr:ribonuclease III [Myxococcales bacterium]MCB9563659.1 ribonuclease III [Kofleriaceae bacterium]